MEFNGERVYHREYCLYINGHEIAYDRGAIRRIYWEVPIGSLNTDIQVYYAKGL